MIKVVKVRKGSFFDSVAIPFSKWSVEWLMRRPKAWPSASSERQNAFVCLKPGFVFHTVALTMLPSCQDDVS